MTTCCGRCSSPPPPPPPPDHIEYPLAPTSRTLRTLDALRVGSASCRSPSGQAPALSDIHIRPIRPDDHERVGQLLVGAYDAVGRFEDDYRSFLGEPDRWVPGASEVFVAERDSGVIGVVAFTLPGDEEFEDMRPTAADAGFRFLAVDPAAQGAGAGRALVRACTDEARRRGAHRIVVHSMWFMTAAHRLYEREGFARRPDLDVRFPSGVGYAFQLDLTDDAPDRFPPPGEVPEEPPWYEDVGAD